MSRCTLCLWHISTEELHRNDLLCDLCADLPDVDHTLPQNVPPHIRDPRYRSEPWRNDPLD